MSDESKARFIGTSGTLPDLPGHLAMGTFDVFQIPYSLVQRDHEDLISQAAEQGAGSLIRCGAARRAPAEGKSWRRGPIRLAEGVARARLEQARADELLGTMSPMELVIGFTLSHAGLSSAFVGTADAKHLGQNIAFAQKGPLPANLYERARQRFSGRST